MQNEPSIAILGFRPHTYWTAVAALAGELNAPRVVERRRIVFAAGRERSVYHHAAELEPGAAAAMIDEVRSATVANAARELGDLLADLDHAGVSVRVAVTAAASTHLPDRLEDIVRVHARMHAAEGNFYRDVVASACTMLGMNVERVVERDLPRLVGVRLGVDQPELDAQLKDMGAALGPPWSEDYRLATLAAWTRLEA
ncbi:MAG: hypothetical protein ACHP84_19330 [Caulobacterales bacterium]